MTITTQNGAHQIQKMNNEGKTHVKANEISNSGMSLGQHDDLSKIVYLRFIVRCGSYDLMTTKLYKGKIYKKITKLWID